MTARVAIYYAPTADDPLTPASAAWLGRDCDTNAAVAQPDIPGIAEITADARGYGFHATLKPPMRLADGCDWFGFADATKALAATLKPFDLPPLAVMDLHGFLALRETHPSPELQHLADACVEALDSFRAPPSAEELARRRRSPLTAQQDAMLVRWGYPYVFETWFFHMTLTRRLSAEEKALYMPKAEAFFADAIRTPTPHVMVGLDPTIPGKWETGSQHAAPFAGDGRVKPDHDGGARDGRSMKRRVIDICLFTQASPGAAFTIAERIPLLG